MIERARTALARWLDPAVRQQVSQTSAAGWTIVRGGGLTDYTADGRTVRRQGWERHPVVHACIRLVADIVAAVPLEVYRKAGDGDATVLPTHELARLLDTPYGPLSAYRWRGRLARHYLTYGNAFVHLERPGRRAKPAALRLVHPEHVRSVDVDPDTDLPVAYSWRDAGGRSHDQTSVLDMLHFADHGAAEDELFGYPRAAAALLDISADHEASQYVRQVVKNDGAPGLMMRTADVMSAEDARAARERWQERRAARGERGSAEWIGGVDEVVQIGFDLAQLEFPDLRRITREDICAVFGVDPRMIGIQSAAKDGGLSGEQYREARFRLIQQTVLPLMKDIESTANVWLAPEWGDVFVRFSPDALAELTEDEAATSTRVLAEVEKGVRTLEEGRRTIGLDENPDPAHHFVTPGTGLRQVAIALEQAAMDPVEAAAAMTAATTPPADGADEKDDDTSGPPSERAALTSRPLSRVLRRGAVLTADERDALWRAFDQRAEREEAAYERAALLRFATERDGVLRTLAEAVPGRSVRADVGDVPEEPADPYVEAALQRIAADYAPGGAYHAAWLEAYEALIRETVRVAGQGIGGELGFSFTLENPRVQAAIRRRVTNLTGHVTQTTVESIRGAIATGRAAGMSMRDIARLIEETTFGEISRSRATTIARTETVGALNEGEWLAAEESGVMQSKAWLSQKVGDARANHIAYDAMGFIPMGQAFPNGMQYAHAPGAPAKEVVHCRCAMLFSDEEAPAA